MTGDFDLRLRLLDVENVIGTQRLEGFELDQELIDDMYREARGEISLEQLSYNNKIRLSQLLNG